MLEYAKACAAASEDVGASPSQRDADVQDGGNVDDVAKSKGDPKGERRGKGGRKVTGKGKGVEKAPAGTPIVKKTGKKRVSFSVEEEEAVMSPVEDEPEEVFLDDDEDEDDEEEEEDDDEEEEDDDEEDEDNDDGMVERLVEEDEVEELEGEETMSSVLRRKTPGNHGDGDSSSSSEDEQPLARLVSHSPVYPRSKSADNTTRAQSSEDVVDVQNSEELLERMFGAMDPLQQPIPSAQDVIPPVPSLAPPGWIDGLQQRKVPFLLSLCSFPAYHRITKWYAEHQVCSCMRLKWSSLMLLIQITAQPSVLGGFSWLSWSSTSPHLPEVYHVSLIECKKLFLVVFRWLESRDKHFQDVSTFEMYLLLCGLLYRDITLAVFDHDADEGEECTTKPLFVRNSILKLPNRDGLEDVFRRVAASIPVQASLNPDHTAAIVPADTPPNESITAALRPVTVRPKPKPRQPPRKIPAHEISQSDLPSETSPLNSQLRPQMGATPESGKEEGPSRHADLSTTIAPPGPSLPSTPADAQLIDRSATEDEPEPSKEAPRRSKREHVPTTRGTSEAGKAKAKARLPGKGKGRAKK